MPVLAMYAAPPEVRVRLTPDVVVPASEMPRGLPLEPIPIEPAMSATVGAVIEVAPITAWDSPIAETVNVVAALEAPENITVLVSES